MLPRKILFTEKQKLIDHFLTDITGEDRRLRFGYQAHDDAVIAYIERSWMDDGSHWFVVDHEDKIIATCHVIKTGEKHAEMGCTVSPAHQGTGIGQSLFDRGANWARAIGCEYVYMQCLSENKAIQHIAKKNGMTTVTTGDEKEATVKIERSELAAKSADAAAEMIAICDTVARTQRWLFGTLLRKSLGVPYK